MREKTCNKCGVPKSLGCFAKCKSNRDGVQRYCKLCQKEYREANKEKALAYSAEYRDKNRESIHAVQRAYVEKNKDKYKAYQESYREKHRERLLEYHKKRSKLKPEYFRQKNRKRDALKLSVTVGEVDYDKILERDGLICYMCGGEVEFRKVKNIYQPNEIHFEHVIALANGGEHSMDNIKVSCGKCDLEKGYIRENK